MMALNLVENPFKVLTPEDMDANDVFALFVDPFTDFNKIRDPGHTMLNGPRGCGKSMIFRYLLPDCQSLELQKPLVNLPFFAFQVSIKNTGPNLTEFRRLHDRHADIVLNEHVLTLFVATKVFNAVAALSLPDDDQSLREALAYYQDHFERRLTRAGGNAPPVPTNVANAKGVFRHITTTCEDHYAAVTHYAKRLAFNGSAVIPYDGALCGYMDFLLPLLQELRRLSFLPDAPIYLLIDDADYLNHTQTVVLNSWVSTRTQLDVSIKISTQLRYKTHATISGLPIQSPHDFQAISVSDVYTTRHGRYLSRVEEIVDRRLKKAGIEAKPRAFFPVDAAQEENIERIGREIKSRWKDSGRGYRADDDVTRYARPEFIKSLGGSSKSTSSYSYAGFEQLVHISSGLVRYFLEPAAVMFDEQQSRHPETPVSKIETRIQDQVIRAAADNLMFGEFDNIRKEEEVGFALASEQSLELDEFHVQMDRLRNLICALGGTFYLKLVSDDSERRVFSVAMSGPPDQQVIDVFELGVRCGYFHRSSIGNKDGTGRTRLYVLTRRLAPFFKLDPSSFAGYLWVTSQMLREAMANPEAILRKVKNTGTATYFESSQLTLFE